MEKTLVTRSTGMLLLKLIENEDMYGYQMIEELARRSDDTFTLKAGTLYPMLHDLEKAGLITAYEKTADNGIQSFFFVILCFNMQQSYFCRRIRYAFVHTCT